MPHDLFASTRPYFILTLDSNGNPQYESPTGIMAVSLAIGQQGIGMVELVLSEKTKQPQPSYEYVFSTVTYKRVMFGVLNQEALSRVTGTGAWNRIASALISLPYVETGVQSFAKEAAHALRNDYAARYRQEMASAPLEELILAQMAAARRL